MQCLDISPASMPLESLTPRSMDSPHGTKYKRVLGDNELSYFLPSRADGVNDMYLHIGFRTRRSVVTPARISLVWAILRLRHPLLASQVEMTSGMYDSAYFAYTPPSSVHDALLDGQANFEIRPGQTKDELIDAYLNGPRTLSNARLSYLLASYPHSDDLCNSDATTEFNIMICAVHFLGDGMALHQTANDFFLLLGGKSNDSHDDHVRTVDELYAILDDEWKLRWASAPEDEQPIPANTELRLPLPKGKFQDAAVKVDFRKNQDRLIGGHTFPRAGAGTRKSVVPTVSFDKIRTKAILKKCKSEGVTISNAIFALCNFAWMRALRARDDLCIPDSLSGGLLPMMMYSALNLRPYLYPLPSLRASSSYWFLAVGYFNVILPSFIPTTASASAIFWHRARSAKTQSAKYMKSPMLVARSQEMAKIRGKRARVFAKEDDEKEAATTGVQTGKHTVTVTVTDTVAHLPSPPASPHPEVESGNGPSIETCSDPPQSHISSPIFINLPHNYVAPVPTPAPTPPATPSVDTSPTAPFPTTISLKNPAPSSALIGLSLLGNLDGTYQHATFPSLELHCLTTGSRQRQAGMLLFGYSFAGKLWLSLGYDVNAFQPGVVEDFWNRVQEGVEEFLES